MIDTDARPAHPAGRWGRAFLSATLLCILACGEPTPGQETGRDGSWQGAPARASSGASSPAADSALRAMAAELLPAVERASGLPVRFPPRLARRSRAELESYLRAELARELPQSEAEALVRAYARFGLVPDTLRLRALLASLYMEQVVGYYDPRADTLFVMEGVEPAQLRAVLAHELVHALQDQYVDLDSLVASLESMNDRGIAARAAIEGHATFGMVEWQLAAMAGTPVDLTEFPGLADLLPAAEDLLRASGRAGDTGGADGSEGDPDDAAGAGVDRATGGLRLGAEMPVLRDAPRVIRESLLFPYIGGLGFIQAWWSHSPGRPAPLGENLPASTEQVLHPREFGGPDRDAPTRLRFLQSPPEGWREVYADGLGELETKVLLAELLAGAPAARSSGERAADPAGIESDAGARESRAASAAAGWDGDRYRLLEGPAGEALVWASAWDGEAEAAAFIRTLRTAYERRYPAPADSGSGADAGGAEPGRRVLIERREVAGRPVVLLLDLPAGAGPQAFRGAGAVELTGG